MEFLKSAEKNSCDMEYNWSGKKSETLILGHDSWACQGVGDKSNIFFRERWGGGGKTGILLKKNSPQTLIF